MIFSLTPVTIKKIFFIFFLTLIFVQQSFAGPKTARERAGFLGPIRMVVEETGTWENGSEVSYKRIDYDTNGKIIKSVEGYNNIGNPVVDVNLKTIFSYDLKRNKEESISYLEDGSVSFKSVDTYRADGKLTESVNYGPWGSLAFKFVHHYDKKGNNIESISYGSDGSIYARYVNSYNEKGHLREKVAYKGDKSIDYKVLYTNDEKGRMTESVIYKAEGSLDEKQVYTYHEDGYQIEKAVYNADGSLCMKETYAYVFDSAGNWVKKTSQKWVSKEGKLSPELPYITKRTITYY
ncbi:MAG TPA: hypothetical protein VI702_00380 [Nitrospiria bacterium]